MRQFLSSAALHGLIVAGLFSFGWRVSAAIWLGLWLFTWAEYLVKSGRQGDQTHLSRRA